MNLRKQKLFDYYYNIDEFITWMDQIRGQSYSKATFILRWQHTFILYTQWQK